MSELTLQFIMFLKFIWVAVYALLYGLGGMYNKAIRRYVGSAFAMLGIVLFSLWLGTFSAWYFLYLPLMILASSLGYGGEHKFVKRLLQGLAFAFTALPLAIVNHSWVLLAIHTGLCVLACLILGVVNPTGSARSEESLLGFSVTIIPTIIIGG